MRLICRGVHSSEMYRLHNAALEICHAVNANIIILPRIIKTRRYLTNFIKSRLQSRKQHKSSVRVHRPRVFLSSAINIQRKINLDGIDKCLDKAIMSCSCGFAGDHRGISQGRFHFYAILRQMLQSVRPTKREPHW